MAPGAYHVNFECWEFGRSSLQVQARRLYFSPRRFTQSLKPLASPDNRMNTPNILEQLRGFDRTSPQFHKHLSNFLRSEGYRSVVPNLRGEDLAWLVEYLDSVSLYTVSL